MTHKLIVIEGIDNVGKTTCCKLLTEKLNGENVKAVYYKTPPDNFSKLTKIINTEGSTDTHFLYHAAMVKYAEQKIIALLNETSVVCDRWFYSTYAYHVAAGSKLQLHWDKLVEKRPDHTFLLLVNDEQERMRRARAKGEYAETHDLLTKYESPILKLADLILRNAGLESIDTTTITIEHVTNIMLRKIIG